MASRRRALRTAAARSWPPVIAQPLGQEDVDQAAQAGIDTSTAVGRMFFQILGAIAEFEHALMSERTMGGLAAARARGRTGGQKPKLTPRQARIAQEMYEETGPDGKRRYTVAQIAAEFAVSRPTIYRHVACLASAEAEVLPTLVGQLV
jgi:DNA invertase Pin-like site-specific DNA recombinase